MKILANRKIKRLFDKILLYIIGFSLLLIVFVRFGQGWAAAAVGLTGLCMGALIERADRSRGENRGNQTNAI